jgi:hypothetical protein
MNIEGSELGLDGGLVRIFPVTKFTKLFSFSGAII